MLEPEELETPQKNFPSHSHSTEKKDTDIAFEKVIQERLRNRFIVFIAALTLVFLFCCGILKLSSLYSIVDDFINYIFLAYFISVGCFFYIGFRGTAADIKKLRSRRKVGGILPTNYKKVQDIDSWSKWD